MAVGSAPVAHALVLGGGGVAGIAGDPGPRR
jgi:hypothetical protein